MSSGGVADMEEWLSSYDNTEEGEGMENSLSIQPFSPDAGCLARIAASCPRLDALSLLVRDRDLEDFAEGLGALRRMQ